MFFSTPSSSFARPGCATPSTSRPDGSADQTVPPYGGYSPSLHETYAPTTTVYQSDHALMDASAAAAAPLFSHSSYGGGGGGVPVGSADASRPYPPPAEDWSRVGRGSVIMAPAKPAENRRKGGRKPKNDKLPPEEEEKRRVRRERNKVAAAKCRQRRVDHTNCLLQETQELEDEGARIAQEVKRLQQMKDHLEQVLRSHRSHCKLDGTSHGHLLLGSSGMMRSGGGGAAMAATMHAAAAAHHKSGSMSMSMYGAGGGLPAACGAMHRQQSSASDSSGQEQSSPPGHHGLLSL